MDVWVSADGFRRTDYVNWKECFPHQYRILLPRSRWEDNRGKSSLLELDSHSLELIPYSYSLHLDSIDVVMKKRTTRQSETENENSDNLYWNDKENHE